MPGRPAAPDRDGTPDPYGVLPRLPHPDAGGLSRGRGRAGAMWAAPGGLGGLPALCAAPAGWRDCGPCCGNGTGWPCRRARSRPSVGVRSHGWRRRRPAGSDRPWPSRWQAMDETGLRVAGETRWLHVMGDGTVTHYRLGARSDVWKGYAGTAVHDRLASYWKHLPDETVHAVCHAHLLRNLEEIVEREQAPDGWAARMQRWLLAARGPGRPLAREDRRPGAGSHPPGNGRGLGRPPGAGPGALREPAPAGPRAPPRPQPGPGPVAGTGGLSPLPGRPGRAPSPTTGRSGPCAWPSRG